MPLTKIRPGLLVVGVTVLIAAPGLSIGSVWSRQRQITELEGQIFLDSTLADPALRESTAYRLSHLQTAEALKWSFTGDATLGVVGGWAGLVLVLAATRRRAGASPGGA